MFTPALAQVIYANAGMRAPMPIPAPPASVEVAASSANAGAGVVAQSSGAVDTFFANLRAIDPKQIEKLVYEVGLGAVAVLILLMIAWTVSGWCSTIVRRALERVKFDQTLTLFLAKLIRWSLLVLAGLAILDSFNIKTTGFAALIGAAGLAIGLAFQGALSNFAAGAMLLIFRHYKVGDEVNVAGHAGTVREIELFTTDIDTPDGRRIVVPNSSIFGAVIENVTHNPIRRASVDVGVAYSADIDETRRVLERAVRSVATVLPEPAPGVSLTELAASSVNWQIRGWAKKENFGAAKEGIIRAVKMELDAAGIGIPFPQLDLHLDQVEQPATTAFRRAA